MQLEQSFELPFARETVWSAFKDIPMLVSCLPGASLAGSADAEPLQFRFAVKLGPISANFAGQGSVTHNADYTGSLSGTGADRATNSRVRGDARFALEEAPQSTRVKLVVDYTLTGSLAQFGRAGIVKELAANITSQFATNLRAKLEERATTATDNSRVAAGESARAEPKPAQPAQLNALALLWSVIWQRMKRLFGRR